MIPHDSEASDRVKKLEGGEKTGDARARVLLSL